ncbi:serine protease [Loigolactobacillus backii]|uniref:S1C family serine protease n=1 Tax=Loigolactobacillus TaxID=2767889 RepID=UPI0007F0A739|nr:MULTISPECIES: trypsin-like peptidase domain-containing protein [Loigolactobacillus]ANK60580.1 serine protease [Loigolactobacillus backii]ANK65533.1 serine protease [Loigolactobacillus backii]ANK68004.1 serine protease [Loigolactobacillus backii]OLF69526.1 serine protease [Loigolactobacillus backii]PIO86774.1 serine protease [Loigolactobacillus backii]
MQNKPSSGLIRTAIVAVVAAVIGGGVVYGGANFFNSGSDSNGSVVNTSKAGSTKVSNVKVSTNSQVSNVFNHTKNSVVSVVNLQKQSSSDSSGLSEYFGGSNSSSDSSSSSSSKDLTEYSEGSGVIYKKASGKAYIVTNNHVVSGSEKLEVILSNGTKLDAKKVGTDSVTDLAVLSIDSAKVTQVASFGNSDSIKVGEPAIAIGSPLGSEYATSVTQGIISAKKRTVPVQDETTGQETGEATVIQTDAAINPGNSGGPLLNIQGQVIGINSMKLSGTGTSSSSSSNATVEGMGFAIPSNEVVKIIDQLVSNGKVVRPALGISMVDLSNISSAQQKSILKIPSSVTGGVVVMSAKSNSPASNAGLKKYDVITQLAGKKVDSSADLRSELYNHNVGDTVSVKYYHDGQEKSGSIKLSENTSQLDITD